MLQSFELGNTVEICNGMVFNFYLRLPYIYMFLGRAELCAFDQVWRNFLHKTLNPTSITGAVTLITLNRKLKMRVCSWAVLVLSPDQIFRTRPADSSKNRVWTLSLRKLGQVYIWWAVNWVIVGVNYIISNWQRLLWCQNICKLTIYA